MSFSGCDNYKEMQINTVDKGQLVLLLYEGAITSVKEAIELIKSPPLNHEKISITIKKAQGFIFELIGSLNMEAGEIANNLYKLYNFIIHSLIQVNIKKDIALLQNVLKVLINLNEAWENIILNSQSDSKQEENNLESNNTTRGISIEI